MLDLITSIIEAIVRVVKVTRESLADDLEEIATKVRAGKLIPDEAFEKAKSDHKVLKDLRDSLPK